MKGLIDKILERLEELHERYINQYGAVGGNPMEFSVKECMEIVKQEAEQYNNAIIDGKYCFQSCACTEKCDKCSRLRNGDIDWYENIDNWLYQPKGE